MLGTKPENGNWNNYLLKPRYGSFKQPRPEIRILITCNAAKIPNSVVSSWATYLLGLYLLGAMSENGRWPKVVANVRISCLKGTKCQIPFNIELPSNHTWDCAVTKRKEKNIVGLFDVIFNYQDYVTSWKSFWGNLQ